jgi:cell division protease FtsH
MDKFDTVNVNESVKNKLRALLAAAKHPDTYEKMGVSAPRSLFIEGENATACSVLAEAYIAEAGLPSVTVTEDHEGIEEVFLDRVKKSLEEAKKKAPSILLIDGLDPNNGRSTDREEMEGMIDIIREAGPAKVFVIINMCLWRAGLGLMMDHPDALGDVRILLSEPKDEASLAFVEREMAKFPCQDVCAKDFLGMLTPISEEDCQYFLRQVAYHAALDGRSKAQREDFVCVLEERIASRSPSSLSGKVKLYAAVHEVGHLVIDELLSPGLVGFVHLGDDGDTLGYCTHSYTLAPAKEILALLGGKAAVEMTFGGSATGCENDLKAVQQLLYDELVRDGVHGFTLLGDRDEHSEHLDLKDEQASVIAYEESKFLDKAKEVIAVNRPFLEAATAKLTEQNFLLASDIDRLLEEHPLDDSPLHSFF